MEKLLKNGETSAIVTFVISEEPDGIRFDLECTFDPDDARPDFRALIVDAYARFRNGVISLTGHAGGRNAIRLNKQLTDTELAIVNADRGES